jgi:hypothetical protein
MDGAACWRGESADRPDVLRGPDLAAQGADRSCFPAPEFRPVAQPAALPPVRLAEYRADCLAVPAIAHVLHHAGRLRAAAARLDSRLGAVQPEAAQDFAAAPALVRSRAPAASTDARQLRTV